MFKEHEKVINEVKLLRSELEKARNEVKTLREFQVLKKNTNMNTSGTPTAKTKDIVNQSIITRTNNEERQSVITLRCKECSFTTKLTDVLNNHKIVTRRINVIYVKQTLTVRVY